MNDECMDYCLGVEAVLASVIATMGAPQRQALIRALEKRLVPQKRSEEADEVIAGLLARVLRPLADNQ